MQKTEINPRPFSYLAWSGAISLIIALGITVTVVFIQRPEILYMENGPLANMQLSLWLLSAFAAAYAYRRWTGGVDRLVAFWVALIGCLAALREVNAHRLLTPDIIGRFGIHYRIEWLFDPQTSILLKLAYACLFLVLIGAIFGPLLFMRSRFWSLTRAGDPGIGMLLVAAAGLGLGYLMDDLFRGSPLMNRAVRQLAEETGNFLIALAFLAGSLLLCKAPVSKRLDTLKA